MTPHIPQITLNNGVQMPILGFGVYQIPPEQTEQAVTDALAAGYRHIDTAAADVELTAEDLQEITAAADRVDVHGERYPEHLQRRIDR